MRKPLHLTSLLVVIAMALVMVTTGMAHAEEAGGLPQMDVSRFPGQLFWLGISFILTYVLMRFIALPQVSAVVDGRHSIIAEKLEKAKAENEEAKRLAATVDARIQNTRSGVQDTLRAASDEGSKKQAAATAAQSAALKAKLAEAESRIMAQKQSAAASLQDEAVQVVGELVKAVSGLSVPANDVLAAVKKEGRV